MKNIAFIGLFTLVFFINANAQKYLSKNGIIVFSGETSIEKIEAVNKQVNAALDASTGDIVFRVLMKSFVFQKALMQEHFNENFVESDTYPNSTFVGKVTNIKDVNITKDGVYNVDVEGKLTIHGVTKQVKEKGTLEVKGNQILAKSKFNVTVADFKITIPAAVRNNIARTMEVTVDLILEKANK